MDLQFSGRISKYRNKKKSTLMDIVLVIRLASWIIRIKEEARNKSHHPILSREDQNNTMNL